MYKLPKFQQLQDIIEGRPNFEGERIEDKITKMTENNEPIGNERELIYQTRNEGINPAYDIRTDFQEIASEAMGIIAKTKEAKRDVIQLQPNEGIEIKKEKPNEDNPSGVV